MAASVLLDALSRRRGVAGRRWTLPPRNRTVTDPAARRTARVP